MKVYVVVCNNGEEWPEDYRHRTDSIHKTHDGAERHIRECKERYEYIENRINELAELEEQSYSNGYKLSEEQMEELKKLYDEYRNYDWSGNANIIEYELME